MPNLSHHLSRRRAVALAATVGALATVAGAGAAPASAAPWNCEASVLRGTVLTLPPLEPVTANKGQTSCRTSQSAGLPILPGPLSAAVLSARTSATGPADKPDQQKVSATGEVADLRVRATPDVPLPELPLPDLPLAQTVISVTGVGTVDLRPALQALNNTRLANVDLLRVRAATATANGECVGGKPQLTGDSRLEGVGVGGVELVADNSGVEQNVNLVDTAGLDPGQLDLTKVILPSGVQLPAVQILLQTALNALPDIQVPATVAQVKLTAGGQTLENGKLTRRALEAQVSVAGQSLVNLVVGEASVNSAGVACTLSATESLLQCTTRSLVLVDVLERAGRVKLLGAADRKLAGQTVNIMFQANRTKVATATVKADGSFETTAPLPARSLRGTNRARYQAVAGSEKSLSLKLRRRMVVSSLSSAGGKVTIAGRVVRPLADPVQSIVVKRRVSCTRLETVRTIKPSSDGSFKVTVDGPANQQAAVYRLQTTVRKTRRNPKRFPTFTLPRSVELR